MLNKQIDFLIIGQGLAGSMLAFELINRGHTVMVLDNSHYGSSSYVAAGIINPITGHRLNLTTGFVDFFQRANAFYKDLEEVFSQEFIRSVEQVRLIKNKGQASYFDKRMQEPCYQDFLHTSDQQQLFSKPEYGCASIKQTSVVDTKSLLKEIQTWLKQQSAYQQIKIDYSRIDITDSGVGYSDICDASINNSDLNKIELNNLDFNNFDTNNSENHGRHEINLNAKYLIFCEGYQAINNPWLKHLPFKLAKGEILSVKPNSIKQAMLSWGSWLVPTNDGAFKLGANYDWNSTELEKTESVKQKLLDSLASHTNIKKPDLVNHEVGVRPTTIDRQAFVGPIKALKNTYCFNGFGSKGCLTIPTHVDLLCDHILNGSPLPEELCKWL